MHCELEVHAPATHTILAPLHSLLSPPVLCTYAHLLSMLLQVSAPERVMEPLLITLQAMEDDQATAESTFTEENQQGRQLRRAISWVPGPLIAISEVEASRPSRPASMLQVNGALKSLSSEGCSSPLAPADAAAPSPASPPPAAGDASSTGVNTAASPPMLLKSRSFGYLNLGPKAQELLQRLPRRSHFGSDRLAAAGLQQDGASSPCSPGHSRPLIGGGKLNEGASEGRGAQKQQGGLAACFLNIKAARELMAVARSQSHGRKARTGVGSADGRPSPQGTASAVATGVGQQGRTWSLMYGQTHVSAVGGQRVSAAGAGAAAASPLRGRLTLVAASAASASFSSPLHLSSDGLLPPVQRTNSAVQLPDLQQRSSAGGFSSRGPSSPVPARPCSPACGPVAPRAPAGAPPSSLRPSCRSFSRSRPAMEGPNGQLAASLSCRSNGSACLSNSQPLNEEELHCCMQLMPGLVVLGEGSQAASASA